MAGPSSAMFCWRLTEVGFLGSQVFEQALMESCVLPGKAARKDSKKVI